tara:strand:- start:92 stop:739 length:648 start_codon:yes stop_codon:yes gene_type:complete
MNKVLLYGGTGQSKIIKDIVDDLTDYSIKGVIDDTVNLDQPFGVDFFIAGKDCYQTWKAQTPDYKDYFFAITIGNPHGKVRKRLYKRLEDDGLKPMNFIHPNAEINNKLSSKGLQIHSRSILNPFSLIGNYCIINTAAIVEHDCILEDCVEVGPNATVCGQVYIGENTWIGAGSVVRDKVKIGKNVIVGAGAVVVNDIPDDQVVVGNPAKLLRKI